MEYIDCGKDGLSYKIKRGRSRRSIAIAVDPNAQVTVLAPRSLDKKSIDAVVRKRKEWIVKKQEYFRRLRELFPPKEFVSGEKFPLLGQQYRLKVVNTDNGDMGGLTVEGRRIFIRLNRELHKNRKGKR